MRVPLSVLIFHLAVAKDHDHLFAGRAVSGKLLSYLMEQSRSARILVQSQSVDLAQKCFPACHHHGATVDLDRDLLICNLAEQIGGRYQPRGPLWWSLWIAGPALLEPAAPRRFSVPSAHLGYLSAAFSSSIRCCQLRPKRRAASVSPMTSYSEAPQASGAKYSVAIFTRSRAVPRSPLIAFANDCRNSISAFVIRMRLPLSITTISSLSMD